MERCHADVHAHAAAPPPGVAAPTNASNRLATTLYGDVYLPLSGGVRRSTQARAGAFSAVAFVAPHA